MNSRITIDSHDIGFGILCYLIELTETGDLDQLVEAGFTTEFLSTLRRLPVNEVSRVAGMLGVFEAVVNVSRIESAITARLGIRSMSDDIHYLAKAGATAAMLCDIFRFSTEEAQMHLATVVPIRKGGRPKMPDNDTRDAIHQWWSTNSGLSLRQRYIALHKAWPTFSVASLHAVINEFNT